MEEIPNNHLGCTNPCKYWDKLYLLNGAGSLPSTVAMHRVQARQGFVVSLTAPVVKALQIASSGGWRDRRQEESMDCYEQEWCEMIDAKWY